MHLKFMRPLAIAFAGVCAVLLACVVHDDTIFPNPPLPAATTPPTRTVPGSGVVTLTGDSTEGTGIGGVGANTPDGGGVSDASPEVAPPDVGSLGSACNVLVTTSCGANNGCYPNPDGTGSCQPAGVLPALAQCTGPALCAPGLTCTPSLICASICQMNQPITGCEGSTTPLCQKLGTSNTVGFCSN